MITEPTLCGYIKVGNKLVSFFLQLNKSKLIELNRVIWNTLNKISADIVSREKVVKWNIETETET